MSKSKVVLVVIGFLVLVAGLVAGVFLVHRRQSLINFAAPATSLSISPSSQNKSSGDSFSLAVEMNTGENRVATIDLVVKFDPQIFDVTDVTPGSAVSEFTQMRKTIDSSGGKIIYSVYLLDLTKALNGSGLTILNISGTVKPSVAAGTYSFTLDDPVNDIGGVGENPNVLIGTTPGSVVIVGATGEPTPTPTTTPTNTPTATTGATATPTPTATATSSGGTSFNSNTSTPIPTPQSLPVTGLSLPTIILGIAGFVGVIMTFIIAI